MLERWRRKVTKSPFPENPEELVRSHAATLRPHATDSHISRELLDWATNALTAVLATVEAQDRVSIRDGLKHGLSRLDDLYLPVVRREHAQADARRKAEDAAAAGAPA